MRVVFFKTDLIGILNLGHRLLLVPILISLRGGLRRGVELRLVLIVLKRG